MHPHAFGLAILVPFLSPNFVSPYNGKLVMADPGANTSTPGSPSLVGPREDHVKGFSGGKPDQNTIDVLTEVLGELAEPGRGNGHLGSRSSERVASTS